MGVKDHPSKDVPVVAPARLHSQRGDLTDKKLSHLPPVPAQESWSGVGGCEGRGRVMRSRRKKGGAQGNRTAQTARGAAKGIEEGVGRSQSENPVVPIGPGRSLQETLGLERRKETQSQKARVGRRESSTPKNKKRYFHLKGDRGARPHSTITDFILRGGGGFRSVSLSRDDVRRTRTRLVKRAVVTLKSEEKKDQNVAKTQRRGRVQCRSAL